MRIQLHDIINGSSVLVWNLIKRIILLETGVLDGFQTSHRALKNNVVSAAKQVKQYNNI